MTDSSFKVAMELLQTWQRPAVATDCRHALPYIPYIRYIPYIMGCQQNDSLAMQGLVRARGLRERTRSFCHLFGCAPKEMANPVPVHPHAISLVTHPIVLSPSAAITSAALLFISRVICASATTITKNGAGACSYGRAGRAATEPTRLHACATASERARRLTAAHRHAVSAVPTLWSWLCAGGIALRSTDAPSVATACSCHRACSRHRRAYGRRRDCHSTMHSTDIPSPSVLKRLLKEEGDAAE